MQIPPDTNLDASARRNSSAKMQLIGAHWAALRKPGEPGTSQPAAPHRVLASCERKDFAPVLLRSSTYCAGVRNLKHLVLGRATAESRRGNTARFARKTRERGDGTWQTIFPTRFPLLEIARNARSAAVPGSTGGGRGCLWSCSVFGSPVGAGGATEGGGGDQGHEPWSWRRSLVRVW